MSKSKCPLVIYHNDEDGFGSAWAFHRVQGRNWEFFRSDYIPEDLPSVKGREVYFLDICFDLEVMQRLYAEADNWFVLDHHPKAREVSKSLPNVQYTSEFSACVWVWKEFHGEPVPRLLEYVQDRDLWKFDLPESRIVNAYIKTLPFEFEAWDEAAKMSEEELISAGKIAKQSVDKYISSVISDTRILRVGGRRVPVLNAPYWAISDILSILAGRRIHPGAQVGDKWIDVVLEEDSPQYSYSKNPPFAVGWYETATGDRKYSLRSTENCVTGYAYNVGSLAESYGGGGHRKASGFFLKKGTLL